MFIPQAVYDELTSDESRYDTQILVINQAINSEKIRVFKVTNQEFIKQLNSRLHSGEIEVIFGAKELGINTVVIDEKAARSFASSMICMST